MEARAQEVRDRFRKHSGELSLLLWAVWNPISVDVPLSEYENYTPTLWRMLEEDAGVEAIAAELKRICDQPIELDAGTNGIAAETLKRWWYWRFEYPLELASESE